MPEWYSKLMKTLGFKRQPVINAPSSGGKLDPKKFAIKRVGYAFVSGGGSNRAQFEGPSFDLEEIESAYNTDSYIRQALDKYTELMFKAGWHFVSKNDKATEYIRLRLAMMAFATGQPMEQFFVEIAESLVKYANVFIIKARAKNNMTLPGINANGIYGGPPVAGYFVLPASSIQIARDISGTIKNYQQKVQGANKPLNIKPEDMIHIYYKRETGRAYGIPFVVPVLDDVRLLREVEENVARLIYRHLHPLYVYKVGLPQAGFEATDTEIEAVRSEIESMPTDGGIVLPERHAIEAIGADGQALDAFNYLKHYEQRVFTGLGVSEVVMGRGNCYDEETQTLTNEGWKYYWEINDRHKIATFNPETSKIEFCVPSDPYYTHIYPYSGDMYHFKSKHIDIKVSPDHDMWIMTNKEKPNWRKTSAKELYEGSLTKFYMLEGTQGYDLGTADEYISIPNIECHSCMVPDVPTKFKTNDFYKFLGHYISKGYLYPSEDGHYPIFISQGRPDVYHDIVALLDSMGLKYSDKVDARNGTHELVVYNKSLWHYLRSNVGNGSYNKRIPRELLHTTPDNLQSIFDALVDSNGSKDSRVGRSNTRYYTVSDDLADDIHELCVLLGYKSKIVKTEQPRSSDFVNRILITMEGGKYRRFKRSYIHKVDYDGVIYCYNVPNHLFITRRNGKIAIQGNTANRGTADNMTTEMHDRVKALQKVYTIFVNNFIIDELLMEGGFDPIANPDDDVSFVFKEIALDEKIKLENHEYTKFVNNAVTFEEMRNNMGVDTVVDEARLYLNMIQIPLAEAKAEAKATASPSSSTSASHENGTGPRSNVQEARHKQSLKISAYADQLNHYYRSLRDDVINYVKQYYLSGNRKFPNYEPREIEMIINLAKGQMIKSAQEFITNAFNKGVGDARKEIGATRAANYDYRSYINTLEDYAYEDVQRLVDDIDKSVSGLLRKSNKDNVVTNVSGIFSALQYRLDFMASSEMMKSYNYGFAIAGNVLDRDTVYSAMSDEENECELCQNKNGTTIKISGEMLNKIPPWHPNCICKLTFKQP